MASSKPPSHSGLKERLEYLREQLNLLGVSRAIDSDEASPSWATLTGETVYFCVAGNVVGFQRNAEGERESEPSITFRQKIAGKVLAVEPAGVWIGPLDESTWNFISFSSITSACLRRPDAV